MNEPKFYTFDEWLLRHPEVMEECKKEAKKDKRNKSARFLASEMYVEQKRFDEYKLRNWTTIKP